jgi:hypothetical protein
MRSFAVCAIAAVLAVLISSPVGILAQSTDQNFPTPITKNEITGSIRARDIGDARVTSFFYIFEGSQGDIFINVVAKNFSGDIDVFTADSLKPLTKMVFYADSGTTETGRLVYLRKPERLMLRIEGRTPNDDPAEFQIKFGGSFVALAPRNDETPPKPAAATERSPEGIRVNSVGTILETVKPVKKKSPADAAATLPEVPLKSEPATSDKAAEPTEKAVKRETIRQETVEAKQETTGAKQETGEPKRETLYENPAAKVTVDPPPGDPPNKATPPSPPVKKRSSVPKPPPEKKPDPLENIKLVVQLKDGTVIERPMSEVLRFNVVNGMLTVTGKDRKVTRYSILDVLRVTIE